MFLTWAVYKPDISMTLNGVLAGLVGVTAGCAAVSQWNIFIGLICGVVFSIEFIDKIKIDDPVEIVHGVCGRYFISRCFFY
jgi:Amt family ammonium transporter